jgi:CheY-like chemotaxis protein
VAASTGAATADTDRLPAQTDRGELPARSLRVLLAEDNSINQAYAVRILTKRGHSVVVANNGAEAIERWEREPFDLVLMDLQMPDVDGFQATTAIREREANSDRHTPIIAFTAHAERERCLSSGMDGYVAKPIQTDKLFAEIERATSSRSVAAPAEREEVAEESTGPVNVEALMERVLGDREFLAELIELFAEDGPNLLEQLRDAISRQDSSLATKTAHTFKGTIGNFCAAAAHQMAYEVERLCREGDFVQAGERWNALKAEVELVSTALNKLLQEA